MSKKSFRKNPSGSSGGAPKKKKNGGNRPSPPSSPPGQNGQGNIPHRGRKMPPNAAKSAQGKSPAPSKPSFDKKQFASVAANNLPAGEKTAKTIDTTRKVVRAAQVGSRATKKVVKGISGFIARLADPVFDIILAVIIIIILLVTITISSMNTVGRNQISEACEGLKDSGGSTTSVTFGDDEEPQERANKLASWLMEQGSWEVNDGEELTKQQAFAIAGNFMHESGMKTKRIEESAPDWESHLEDNNEQIDVYTREYDAKMVNIGLGLAQWTWNPGRAESLIKKARETGTIWSDAQPQLELIKDEMNGPYAAGLKAAGFADKSKTTEELASIFHDVYEVSNSTPEQVAARGKTAKELESNYANVGTTNGKSFGSACEKGSNLDMSSMIAFAISMAWPPEDAGKSATGGGTGKPQAKPEYIEGKEAIMEEVPDPQRDLYASCDRYVATVVITFLDEKFPWGNVAAQKSYMLGEGKDKWKEIEFSDLQPGDVIINHHDTPGTEHVELYIGDYNGTDSIAAASYLDRTADIQTNYHSEGDGWRYFRYTGEPRRTSHSIQSD